MKFTTRRQLAPSRPPPLPQPQPRPEVQLIWLSGPTAKVVSVSIGLRTILLTLAVLAAMLFAFGSIVQLLGIRIAVEARPELARSLGGITSIAEQERIAQRYEEQIAQLHARVDLLASTMRQLEESKKALVELLPAPLAETARGGAQGGPLRRLIGFEWFAPRATDALSTLELEAGQVEQQLDHLLLLWARERELLQTLPLGKPLLAEHQLSSGFGFRRDPFGMGWARHDGLDFVAPPGTGIHATAAGKVLHADDLGPYGLTVDIEHRHGFSTRYAHLSAIDVAVGEQVEAGQLIGRLGSTGRSTGPHLHYEVRVQGRPIAPLPGPILKAARTQAGSTMAQRAHHKPAR